AAFQAIVMTDPELPLTAFGLIAEIYADAGELRAYLLRMIQDAARRIGLGADGDAVRAKDARLLASDVLPRGAEIVHVIEVDRGQHGHVGVDDVHRVQPPTQPHFQDEQVQSGAGKKPERGEGTELEVG